MDRRITGLLLVVVTVLVTFVIGGLQSRAIKGTAATGRIPAPPHIGQCLLQAPPDPSMLAAPDKSYRLGSCSAAHYGEVAEVVLDGVHTPTGPAYPMKPCADENAYLGWHPPAGVKPGVRWRPIDLTVISMNPTALQRAFGQTWVVCVVTPAVSGASYTGSVRDALIAGRLPVSFAQCLLSVQTSLAQVPCDRPHRYEMFGSAMVSNGARDRTALDSDCRRIVSSSTRMADTGAAGRLTVAALPFHWDPAGNQQPGWPAVSTDLSEAVCTVGVVGNHQLSGTLYGLGNRELPWA